MGDTGDDTSLVARFTYPPSPEVERFVPVAWRVHFRGGTGTAKLTVFLRSKESRTNETTGSSLQGGSHDVRLIEFPSKGTGADMNFAVSEGDYEAWVFDIGDDLVFEWTDPDTTLWGIEILLAPAP